MPRPVSATPALAALLVLSAGCYRYRDARPAELAAGAHAAVALTDTGSAMLAPAVGPRAARIEGRVISAEPSGVTLAVSSIVRGPHQAESWPRESVRVPMSAVQRFQVRQLDRKRSVIFAGVTMLGLVATRAVIDANSGGGGGRSGGGQVGQ